MCTIPTWRAPTLTTQATNVNTTTDSASASEFVLSSEFAYANLADGGVAIYARDSGDTHFVAASSGDTTWVAGASISGQALLDALAARSSTPQAEFDKLLRLGVLTTGAACA